LNKVTTFYYFSFYLIFICPFSLSFLFLFFYTFYIYHQTPIFLQLLSYLIFIPHFLFQNLHPLRIQMNLPSPLSFLFFSYVLIILRYNFLFFFNSFFFIRLPSSATLHSHHPTFLDKYLCANSFSLYCLSIVTSLANFLMTLFPKSSQLLIV
jgi:hypothetical protein